MAKYSLTLREVFTGVLISTPYVLSSILMTAHSTTPEPEIEPNGDPTGEIDLTGPGPFLRRGDSGGCFIKACVLASATLLLVGAFEKFRGGNSVRDACENGVRRKSSGIDSRLLRASCANAISVWLPLFASLTLGGERVALSILLVLSSGLPTVLDSRFQSHSLSGWSKPLKQWRTTVSFLVAMMVFDLVAIGSFFNAGNSYTGYLALLLSVFVIRPPFRNSSQPILNGMSPEATSAPSGITRPVGSVEFIPKKSGSGNAVPDDETTATLLAGAAFSFFTYVATALFSELSVGFFNSLATAAVACFFATSLVLSTPRVLRSSGKMGLASGSALSVISTSAVLQRWSWPFVAETCFGVLGYFAAYFDRRRATTNPHSQRHSHHTDADRKASRVSLYLLRSCEQYPLLHSILREKDSRRIFYFMRFAFSSLTYH